MRTQESDREHVATIEGDILVIELPPTQSRPLTHICCFNPSQSRDDDFAVNVFCLVFKSNTFKSTLRPAIAILLLHTLKQVKQVLEVFQLGQ
jgi:hypothetical protein